jgi:membrane protein YfhO
MDLITTHRKIVLVSLLSLVVSAWLVWGPWRVMQGVDYQLTHHYYKVYLRDSLREGVLPFWNPYVYLGRPFLADPEVAAFYPPTWLFVILPESLAFWLCVSLHFVLAVSGFRRLAQRWGAGEAAAWVGGWIFALSPPFIAHLEGGMMPYICVLAWWPWLLDCIDQLIDEFSARRVLILAAMLFAAFLAGHPHAFWMECCFLGFFIFGRSLAMSWAELRNRLTRGYGSLLVAAVACLALGAIQLLPTLELSRQGNRVEPSEFLASFASLEWKDAASVFVQLLPNRLLLWDVQLYVTLPVFVFGLYYILKFSDSRMRGLLVASGLCLVLALGHQTPFFKYLYRIIPEMGSFRLNARFGMFACFSTILAAACGVQQTRVLRIVLLTILVAVVSCVIEYKLSGTTVALIIIYISAAGTIATACLLAKFPRAAAVLLVATIAVDGGFAAWKSALYYSRAQENVGKAGINSEFLKNLGVRYPRIEPVRTFVSAERIHANSGMETLISNVTGNVALCSARVWYYLYLGAKVQPLLYQLTYVDESVFDAGPFPYQGASIDVGWDAKSSSFNLNPAVEPRAWLVSNISYVPNWFSAIEKMSAGFDVHNQVLLEGTGPLDNSAVLPEGRAKFIQYKRNSALLEVETNRPATLVFADAWFPGWEATVNGTRVKVRPANAWMRSVAVPAGKFLVEFRYRPTFFWLGATVTLASLLIWLKLWRVFAARAAPT